MSKLSELSHAECQKLILAEQKIAIERILGTLEQELERIMTPDYHWKVVIENEGESAFGYSMNIESRRRLNTTESWRSIE